jgi:hypothetical protein
MISVHISQRYTDIMNIVFTYIQYTPSVSTVILSGPTYSSQNVWQMSDKFESQHSLSPTIWSDILVLVGHFGRTWEWILKDFFLHFPRWICQTFCDRCVFVSVLSFRCVECAGSKYPSVFLPCTIFAPGKVAPRSIFVTLGHNSRSMHRSTS